MQSERLTGKQVVQAFKQIWNKTEWEEKKKVSNNK